jgi:hypothetical protein
LYGVPVPIEEHSSVVDFAVEDLDLACATPLSEIDHLTIDLEKELCAQIRAVGGSTAEIAFL